MFRAIDSFECPYCAPNSSSFAIDAQLLLHPAKGSKPPKEVRLPFDPLPNFVQLVGAGQTGRLCPHVVALVADIEVMKMEPGGRNTLFAYSIIFDHCWFAEHDADDAVNVALWTEIEDDGRMQDHDLGQRFERISLVDGWPLGEGWELEISGSIYVASKPVELLEELRSICI